MRNTFVVSALAAATLLVSSSAFAATASQREYQRGYADCSKGAYDQNQHGASYKKGCRAAEDKTAAASPDTMLSACRARAASAYRASASDIDVKYEGQRVDGTHAVNGSVTSGDPPATFQCSFNKAGSKITRFVRNKPPRKSAAAKGVCPPDVSQADRYKYPACK